MGCDWKKSSIILFQYSHSMHQRVDIWLEISLLSYWKTMKITKRWLLKPHYLTIGWFLYISSMKKHSGPQILKVDPIWIFCFDSLLDLLAKLSHHQQVQTERKYRYFTMNQFLFCHYFVLLKSEKLSIQVEVLLVYSGLKFRFRSILSQSLSYLALY